MLWLCTSFCYHNESDKQINGRLQRISNLVHSHRCNWCPRYTYGRSLTLLFPHSEHVSCIYLTKQHCLSLCQRKRLTLGGNRTKAMGQSLNRSPCYTVVQTFPSCGQSSSESFYRQDYGYRSNHQSTRCTPASIQANQYAQLYESYQIRLWCEKLIAILRLQVACQVAFFLYFGSNNEYFLSHTYHLIEVSFYWDVFLCFRIKSLVA